MTDDIDKLLSAPSESRNVEIKTWLDVDAPDDRAKIARALIALRNSNGGQLIFGFDDKTLQPDEATRPPDIESSYHADKIIARCKQTTEVRH